MSITTTPQQLLYDSAVPSRDEPRLHPWQKLLPPRLYKYYPPERFHILTDCAVRFSQREVFDDQYDLRPQVERFGTAEEIRAFMDFDPVLNRHPDALKSAVINHVLNTPGAEERLIAQAQHWLTAPEQFGVFCLCENSRNRDMWNRYAADGTGFLLSFDTRHPGFVWLRSPGLIGKVEYGDTPISSFLSRYGASSFFRKRERYRFEAEWRSIRALRRFKNVLHPEHGPAVYLAPFSPECVSEILILPDCAIEWELRTLVAVDCRYRHASVSFLPGFD